MTKRKLSAAVAVVSLLGALIAPTVPAAAATQVSVFGPASMGGGGLGCSDEVDNLVEIIGRIDGYTVDRSITTLGAGLLGQLNSSKFFFVPDMESGFNPSSPTDFPSSAVTDFQTWLDDGGVLVMTGTSGTRDIDFLNKITSWGLASATALSPASRVDANAAGTPFGDADLAGVTLAPHSATDAVNKSSAPSGANFTTMWGTDSQAAVAVMTYGRGKIIYLAWDFFDSGFNGATECSKYQDPWVQKVVPAALRYATQLAEAAAAARSSSSTPPSPRIPTFDAFAAGPAFVTPGQDLTLTGSRLFCTTYVQINSQPTTYSYGTMPGGFSQLTIAIPADLKPGPHSMSMDSCGGPVTFDGLLVVPKEPAVFEAVSRNGLERMLLLARLQTFVLVNRLDYNHAHCIVNASVPALQTAAKEMLRDTCKIASGLLSGSKGSTSELRNTHKPANLWVRVTLSNK